MMSADIALPSRLWGGRVHNTQLHIHPLVLFCEVCIVPIAVDMVGREYKKKKVLLRYEVAGPFTIFLDSLLRFFKFPDHTDKVLKYILTLTGVLAELLVRTGYGLVV
jgi:hypothetical protein